MANAEIHIPTQENLHEKFLEKLEGAPEQIDEITGMIINLFSIDDRWKYFDTFRKQLEQGRRGIIVGNHPALPDIFGTAALTQQTKTVFRTPIASSIPEGQQGDDVQFFNQKFGPSLKKRNLETIPVVTRGDKIKRGMVGENVNEYKTLLETFNDGYGFAIYPAQTVEEGRRGEDGKPKGMQELEYAKNLVRFMKTWVRQGHHLTILPIAFEKSNEIFDPNDHSIPLPILRMLLRQSKLRPAATVHIGPPLAMDEVANNLTDHVFMKIIAGLLPRNLAGFYASSGDE